MANLRTKAPGDPVKVRASGPLSDILNGPSDNSGRGDFGNLEWPGISAEMGYGSNNLCRKSERWGG